MTLALAVVLTCSTVSAAERWFAHDGDTLWHDKNRIQLLGIDAPELSQPCFDAADKIWPCGRYARDHIRHLIATGDVSCTIEGKDRYDNDVGVCFVGGIDLGRDLVKHGLAVADKQTHRYLAEEREARIATRNLWAGNFIDPGEYRRGGRR
ncbi:thermonuclease family protein [Mesorhizobium sophorae]|uniref:thermonuclease family protein n=1 Tax=Mesorhizobium sophorae TaxID=1300294 RepID=UPI00142D81AE|nr:thermonuclease family protein [Mesorhizobium sophorae]